MKILKQPNGGAAKNSRPVFFGENHRKVQKMLTKSLVNTCKGPHF